MRIVAAACLLVASACEKEPPTPPAALVAREQSPEPPRPPAAPAAPIAAARACSRPGGYLEENPSPQDGLRNGMEHRIKEHETALAKAEQKIATSLEISKTGHHGAGSPGRA